jgi:hypothetical protein
MRTSGAVVGVADPFGALRLYRISLIRDLLKETGDAPIVSGDGWGANLELLRRAVPLARRMETVPLEPRYDVRERESRIHPWSDGLALFRARRTGRAARPSS